MGAREGVSDVDIDLRRRRPALYICALRSMPVSQYPRNPNTNTANMEDEIPGG
jgi:hypothetical protein